ncbi:MAG: tRNA-intron lyase [Candidatus Micrarchaeota archaeon]|nr:tRNA-intron lyase [Candidatus Micrarchaeota archaeon]
MIKAELARNRVFVWDRKAAKKLFEKEFYGKLREDRLELSLLEACLLLERKMIKLVKDGNELSFKEFYDYCTSLDKRFEHRYRVYRDLRSRGLPTRTGFKFGCDFRVYERGVHPLKRGKKTPKEHTKWVVFAVPEGYTFSFHELSRAVRLAHNIRANMLWAVVSKDGVRYFSVRFFKP